MADLRARKIRLLEELAGAKPERPKEEIAGEIKAVQGEIRSGLRGTPEPVYDWPLTHEQVDEWIGCRYWQFASTMPHNPHEYTLSRWGDRTMFERVVLFIREFGYQNIYGRGEYTQLDVGDFFYWTMGDALETTILINRKPISLGERRPPRGA